MTKREQVVVLQVAEQEQLTKRTLRLAQAAFGLVEDAAHLLDGHVLLLAGHRRGANDPIRAASERLQRRIACFDDEREPVHDCEPISRRRCSRRESSVLPH